MRRSELQQLKNKPAAELKLQLDVLQDKMWELKKDLKAGKVKNVREIRSLKKDIARIITFLNSQNHANNIK